MIDGIRSNSTALNIGTVGKMKLKGLRFTHIKDESYSICGSIHKFKNNGFHNADNFTLKDLIESFNKLYQLTGLNPETTRLNGFEFGVNIILPIKPIDAISKFIIHKSNTGEGTAEYRKYKYGNYYSFKIYDKSEITLAEPYKYENILRIEIKVQRMKYIRAKGVFCNVFADLYNESVWKRLEEILIETINECLIIDFSLNEIANLKYKELLNYKDYINPRYWESLHKESRKKFAYHKKQCEKFITKHSEPYLKQLIIDKIHYKCIELRNVEKNCHVVKKWDKFTAFDSIK